MYQKPLIEFGTRVCYLNIDKIELMVNYFSCLDNRKQKVTFKSCASSINSFLAGVPQAPVLGPLLFLICINAVAKPLLSLIRLFADDSSLFYAA